MKVIDLTHTLTEGMPVYPGTDSPIILRPFNISEHHFREAKLTLFSHTGTHIDAPAHMLATGSFLDQLPVSHYIGKAIIIDISSTPITLKDLIPYEASIQQVDFVIFNTGWHKSWGTKQYFKNFPSLSEEAALWLTAYNLKGIGIDAISVDKMDAQTMPIHNILLSQNMIIIENLANLDAVTKSVFTLSVLPLKIISADGSPVRAIAIENNADL